MRHVSLVNETLVRNEINVKVLYVEISVVEKCTFESSFSPKRKTLSDVNWRKKCCQNAVHCEYIEKILLSKGGTNGTFWQKVLSKRGT